MTVTDAGLGLPSGVTLRWLGVAGFALSYQGTTVLVDPYVSRIPLADSLFRRAALPDPDLIDRWIPRADAVLLGHTHFDHAVDAPAVAVRDGAIVYGGASAVHLMRLHGQAGLAVGVEPHLQYGIGPFTVTFVPSRHSRLLLGRRVPSSGEITCEHVGALNPQAYRCGQVWGIHIAVDTPGGPFTLYHQGSADLVEDQIRHRGVDVFLCGVAGRQFTDDYTSRVLRALQPERVVVTHHDDFFVPLGEPQGYAFGVAVDRFPDEVAAVSTGIRVMALPAPTPVLDTTPGRPRISDGEPCASEPGAGRPPPEPLQHREAERPAQSERELRGQPSGRSDREP